MNRLLTRAAQTRQAVFTATYRDGTVRERFSLTFFSNLLDISIVIIWELYGRLHSQTYLGHDEARSSGASTPMGGRASSGLAPHLGRVEASTTGFRLP